MVESFSMMASIELVRHEIDDSERKCQEGKHGEPNHDPLVFVYPRKAFGRERRALVYVTSVKHVEPFFKNGPYEQQTNCV